MVGTPGKLAFDSAGNLWIPFCSGVQNATGTVAALSPSALKSIAHNRFKNVPVEAVLSDSVAQCPVAVEFDASGNLWVSKSNNGANPAVVKYASSDLFSPGAQPATALTLPGLHYLKGMSFDAKGNLWLTDRNASVYEFTAQQLASGGSQTPQLTLQSTFQFAQEVAFDGAGNLWVAYFAGPVDPRSRGAIVEYAASDLAGSGSIVPSPVVVLRGPELCSPLDVCAPVGEAFDASGNLWVSGRIALYEYSPEQQLLGGSPLATVILATNFYTVWSDEIRDYNFEGEALLTFGPEIK